MLLIAFLICSSNFESCIARRSKHWRQSSTVSASVFKKKGKTYGNSHKNHHSKPKPPPTHKSTPPLPKAPPHKAIPSPPPIPKSKVSPSTPPPKSYNGEHSTIFNVLDYGAKGDGNTDDTKVTLFNFIILSIWFQNVALNSGLQ